jgi:hypothetical protein
LRNTLAIATAKSSSPSVVASVREKMNEPTAEQKTFAEFCKTWDALPEHHPVEFVKSFSLDIRELLGGLVVQ